jgi:serine/threonine protein kinase
MTLDAGTSIGRYRIVSSLGSGGMGEVFLAQDSRLDRNVALKILPRELADDPDRMSRFVREAKSASALNHPNILTIHEIGEGDGYHYLATELVVGATLRARVARGPLPLGDCVEIGAQVAAALVAAHDAGIVHRDIKPENVMIRTDGLVKVLDFGLAKWRSAEALDRHGETLDPPDTRPGVILGTVAYMSPEQSRGKAVDGRTDLWSLGVVLYELMTGRQPFEGESSIDVLANILHREPPPLTLRREDAPHELVAIVGKALAKTLAERYSTAQELLSDLRSLKTRLQATAEPEPRSSPDGELDGPAPAPTRSRAAHSGARHAIAVLPFRNLSADAENEYFCDGLAEELLNALAKIDGLKVAARTSAFAFKGKRENISEIGRALGVTTVLEGSVRSSANRMRIAVQLVNAADGFQVWSDRYDRES